MSPIRAGEHSSAPATMRQVRIEAPGHVRLVSAEVPVPGEDEVRVRSRSVGICGSDLHALAGRHPFIDLPYIPGHEVCGVIDALGSTVSGFAIGDRVLLEPNVVCGTCRYCRSGRYNLCENLVVVGCQSPGAMADAFVVGAARLRHVPPTVDDGAAALVEPLATATHAVRLAGELEGAGVAVLGAGTIGLLTLRAALAAGAAKVTVTDPVASKRDRAQRLGADSAFDPGEDGVEDAIRTALGFRPDVIFDCVSNQASVAQSVRLAERGGTVIIVGVPEEPVTIDLPTLQDREVLVRGSAMYVSEDVARAVELVEVGWVVASELITATFPLAQATEAFAVARRGDNVKVQLRVEPSTS